MIDWSKPIQTDKGDPLHYVGRLKNGRHLVERNNCIFSDCDDNGLIGSYMDRVINVPQKRWVNLYWDGPDRIIVSRTFKSEKEALGFNPLNSMLILAQTVEVEIPQVKHGE